MRTQQEIREEIAELDERLEGITDVTTLERVYSEIETLEKELHLNAMDKVISNFISVNGLNVKQ